MIRIIVVFEYGRIPKDKLRIILIMMMKKKRFLIGIWSFISQEWCKINEDNGLWFEGINWKSNQTLKSVWISGLVLLVQSMIVFVNKFTSESSGILSWFIYWWTLSTMNVCDKSDWKKITKSDFDSTLPTPLSMLNRCVVCYFFYMICMMMWWIFDEIYWNCLNLASKELLFHSIKFHFFFVVFRYSEMTTTNLSSLTSFVVPQSIKILMMNNLDSSNIHVTNVRQLMIKQLLNNIY